MARGLASFQIAGVLGNDAETRYTSSGIPVSRLSVATSERQKKGEEWQDVTYWHSLTLWRSEGLLPYLTKGSSIVAAGKIQPRSYEDKDGQKKYTVDFVIDSISLMGGKGGQGEGGGKSSKGQGSAASKPDSTPTTEDDDCPF